MLDIKITHDLQKLVQSVDVLGPKRLAFATKNALNDVAPVMLFRIQKQMQAVFDNPSPYTLNALKHSTATTSNQRIVIDYKKSGLTSPGSYLIPQELGGEREQTPFEKSLSDIYGHPNLYAIPVARVSGTTYREVLQYLRGNRLAPTYKKGRLTAQKEYFTVLPGSPGRLSPGVYHRIANQGGRGLVKLFSLVRKPKYRPRFDFYKTAEKTLVDYFPRAFNRRVREELHEALRRGKNN